jgi:4-hydroxy-3-methylbut-2-en-1-yl diphosphate reductase
MKSFLIPEIYKSDIIGQIKKLRRLNDHLKKDFSPTILDFGPVKFLIARHFGFCYGVENAIEIAYKAILENAGKSIYLLSEMIHNPEVNADLLSRGVKFIMDTKGRQLIDWDMIGHDSVVIVPAFGTTLEIQSILKAKGIDPYEYDTTCPFVEKVWKRASQIGQKNYTIVVHGKPNHEETRATFSHSKADAPTIIIKDMAEAEDLAQFIRGERPYSEFYTQFAGQFSLGFDPEIHLKRIGVVNQTTMLASETQAISDYLKNELKNHYKLSSQNLENHFADTRDTLCYATNDNQNATLALINHDADFAIVAGGYNSSNTSHLVELCEEKIPTYYVESAHKIMNDSVITHFDLKSKSEKETINYIPQKESVCILLTCGASCPDAVMEGIIEKIVSFFPESKSIEEVKFEF